MPFKPATRSKTKARLAFVGMSKSGKSLTSLALLRGIVGPEGRIAAVDTENGALSLYAGRFPGAKQPSGFDVQELTVTTPDAYIKCIGEAAAGKYDGLLIDSTSQEWHTLLEMVDGQVDKYFTGWKMATPKHNAFIRAIVSAPLHIIVTIRQKDDYIVENRDGRNVPVKVGLEPIQRKQFEYEFNAVMTIDLEHNIRVTHSAIDFLPNGTIIPAAAADMEDVLNLGRNIRQWLDQGEEEWSPPVYKKAFYVNDREYISAGIERDSFIKLSNLGVKFNKLPKAPKGGAKAILEKLTGKLTVADMTEAEAQEVIKVLEAEIAKGEAA